MISIVYRQLPHAEGLQLPAYESEDAAGIDIVAAVPAGEGVVLAPGSRGMIATGLAIELPKGFEAQIRPRSGLALNDGVTVLNSPGTIDADYRGEIGVILINFGTKPFAVRRGANSATRRFFCGTRRSDCERASHVERPWLKWIRFHGTLIVGGMR